MINTILKDESTGESLRTEIDFDGKKILIIDSIDRLKGLWTSVLNLGVDTTIPITSKVSESFLLTDIIIGSKKPIPNSSVVIRISDGTNNEVLIVLDNAQRITFSHSFRGGIRSWKDSYVEVITDTNLQEVSTLCVYARISIEYTQTYNQWKASK
jgi:hypothetical protein